MKYKLPHEEELIKVPRFEESAGFYTTKQRSKLMSKIKAKNTKPEIALRKALWAKGLRYRIHAQELPGRPDIVIKKYRLAIFVDGEFWHGYRWQENKGRLKKNTGFWIPKIERNIQKDRINVQALRALGYTVFRFWSGEVQKNPSACVNQVMLYIETKRDARIPFRVDI